MCVGWQLQLTTRILLQQRFTLAYSNQHKMLEFSTILRRLFLDPGFVKIMTSVQRHLAEGHTHCRLVTPHGCEWIRPILTSL